ncbi:hypothetical protein ACFLZ0_02370 [Patescibacteria group bacterium]
MTDERRNEIAYLVLKREIENDKFRFVAPDGVKRILKNKMKGFHITIEEFEKFVEIINSDILRTREAFGL